jgi:heme oxygenase
LEVKHHLATEDTTAASVKKATAQQHLSTEKALIKHVQSIHSVADYAALLYCLYGYFAPLEERITPYLDSLVPDHTQRRKAAKLLEDLQTLNYPLPQRLAQELPSPAGAAEALACFYVMEGSTLGGAIIKKLVHGQCGAIPETAFSFFSGYGEHNMAMWQSFVAIFNTAITTASDTRLAIAAAHSCFVYLENWINAFYRPSNGGLQ